MKKSKIVRSVVILGLVSFFTDLASEMLYPITPLFLTSVLGASMASVGIIEGIAEITAGLLKGYFGSLSDKLGKRSIFVIIGYGISGLVKPLPGLIPHYTAVLFSRVADRVGKGIRTAPRDALLASYADGNSGAVFGFHRSMDTFGAVAGPLAAIGVLYFIPNGYKTIYLLSIIPSMFAIYFTFLVKDKKGTVKIKQKSNMLNFWKNAPRQYKFLTVCLTLFSLANSSDVFLILKSKDIAKSDVIAIMGYVFYNFIYAALSYPVGMIADRYGKKKVFISGLFIFSIVYMGFALGSSFAMMWVLFALYGLYAAASEGVTKAWVSDLIPGELRGTAIGLITMCISLAAMFGSVLTGVLWDSFGSQIPFVISSVVSVIIAVLLLKI
ncbi:MAG: MFS transporter [bacterium]